MKKLITLLAGVVLAASMAGSVYAQAAGPTGGGVQSGAAGQNGKAKATRPPIAPKILKQLNLTPDQHKQIKALVESFAKKRQDEQKTDAKPNRKEMAENRKAFLEDLGKILTPEQKDKLKTLMEQSKKGKKGKDVIPPTPPTTTSGGAKTGGGL